MKLFENKLGGYFGTIAIDNRTIKACKGLSQAEISRICDELIKASILHGETFSNEKLQRLIDERSKAYQIREA